MPLKRIDGFQFTLSNVYFTRKEAEVEGRKIYKNPLGAYKIHYSSGRFLLYTRGKMPRQAKSRKEIKFNKETGLY